MTTRSFPEGFRWGTATAAHQVEGGNWNNDWWEWEHTPGSGCTEPSFGAYKSVTKTGQSTYHLWQGFSIAAVIIGVFTLALIVWAAISVFLFVIWVLAGGGFPWFVIAVGAWGIVVVAHAAFAFVLRSPEDILLEREEKERRQNERGQSSRDADC